MSGKLGSECCGANPYFALGYIHGIHMAENGKYYGICGECKEHAEFNKQTEIEKAHDKAIEWNKEIDRINKKERKEHETAN
tara:strand:- start:233 stop:475 length:243 start_codon:yes stop_codon:yes gene_type:complete